MKLFLPGISHTFPLRPNIYKAFDFLVHEIVLIKYFLRDQADGNFVVLILRHDLVEVKVIDVNHKVPGS